MERRVLFLVLACLLSCRPHGDELQAAIAAAKWPNRGGSLGTEAPRVTLAIAAYERDYASLPELMECESEDYVESRELEYDARAFANGICEPRTGKQDNRYPHAELHEFTSLFGASYDGCRDIFADPLLVDAL